jgi:conjugal transfer pilus assembly protein TrbC
MVLKTAFVILASSILASVGVMAQENETGIDPQKLSDRAKAAHPEAEAFVREVQTRGRQLEAEARALNETARARARAQTSGLAIPGLAKAKTANGVNLDAVLQEAATLQAEQHEEHPRLIAFVSASMPKASFRQVVNDVGKAGGVVALRGFPGGTQKLMAEALRARLEPGDAISGMGIDPRLFRAFDVAQVPVYVVLGADIQLCDDLACDPSPPPHDRMTGNVTLEHALETFSTGKGPGARSAKAYLTRLRKRGDR